ncbi:uncharacterized protein LOC115918268 [Strongylocentrotus purpuratus]|uniref:Uncharacterized protein n=1 Tax=Strongylocentrotus purpuratus TaxID=7668 RepID=A0A7M7SSG6_STRPU|nr:uncharacterized protein LOC115918268 [Strongylocentrotus purpuratus]|eukprot:XP_790861.1 PREDICTED: uncharacterized protein LOC585965 [Strongylocentrotus purpuratus]
MAFTRFIILVALIAASYAQFLELDSFNIDSPSVIYDGEVFDVQFDVTFTPTGGAASIITNSHGSTRFMPVFTLSEDGETLDLDAYSTVELTSAQQTTALTDDDSVTWSNLEASLNLTDIECGDGSVYQYACVSIMAYTGVTWSGVDTSNSSMCSSFVCKAVADVAISALTITNPDDSVIGIGGGQAVDFDITISNPSGGDNVVGSDNWIVKFYLSDEETGGTEVASETISLSSSQETADINAGSTSTFSDLAVTLTLDDVTCDDFAYACSSVEPASAAYWTRPASPSDNYVCVSVTCGAAAIKTSLMVMLLTVIVSLLFNH